MEADTTHHFHGCLGRHWNQATARHKDQDTHLQWAALASVVGTSAMKGRNLGGSLSPSMDIQNCTGHCVAAAWMIITAVGVPSTELPDG